MLAVATALPYMSFVHTVLSTPVFLAQASRAGLGDDELQSIEAWLSVNPKAGALIRGAGGARKVRFPGRGKGKSGGYRTIHFFGGDDVPLFLLALTDKGQEANLSKASRNELARTLPKIAEAYRAGVAERIVASRRLRRDQVRKGTSQER
jgi:hypothetical protein